MNGLSQYKRYKQSVRGWGMIETDVHNWVVRSRRVIL